MNTIPKHILSKSTFMYGCQCPKRLFLHKFRQDLANPEDEQQQAIFQQGTNVGELAQQLFPGGVDASPASYFEFQQSVADTAKYISEGHTIIYEAAFQYDGILCAVDILVKKDDQWHAYEVKSTNSVKDQHELDAAFQYYVLQKSGLPLADFSVITFNKKYIKIGEIDVQELFMATSVQQYAQEQTDFIASKIEEFKSMLSAKVEPVIEPGPQCFKPYECNFTQHCRKNMEEDVILDTESLLPEIDKDRLNDFISQLEYPLYFFDFETVMYGVPKYDYSSPYQKIPFQFSLHVQQNENAPVEHYAFLGDGVNDPRYDLIKDMIQHLGNEGSIIGWWIHFEKGVIEQLASNFPEYKEALMPFRDRMVDLIKPFKSGAYKHAGFNGSNSLKSVLPVVVPELSYGVLEIQEGGTASFTYAQLAEMEEEEQIKQRQNLLEYCHLDTFAMVKILDKLKEL